MNSQRDSLKAGIAGSPNRHPSLLHIKKNNVSERKKLFERQSCLVEKTEEEENNKYGKDTSQQVGNHSFKNRNDLNNNNNKNEGINNYKSSFDKSISIHNDEKIIQKVGHFGQLTALKELICKRDSSEKAITVIHTPLSSDNLKPTILPKSKNSIPELEIDINNSGLSRSEKDKIKRTSNGIKRLNIFQNRYQSRTTPSYSSINPIQSHSTKQGFIATNQATKISSKALNITHPLPKLPPKPPRMYSYPPPSSIITLPPQSTSIYEYLANTHSQVTPLKASPCSNRTCAQTSNYTTNLLNGSHSKSCHDLESKFHPQQFDTSNICTPPSENEQPPHCVIKCPVPKPRISIYTPENTNNHHPPIVQRSKKRENRYSLKERDLSNISNTSGINKNGRSIMEDSNGYAVPSKLDHTPIYRDCCTPEERSLLKTKVNDAYSILRPMGKEAFEGSVEDLTEGGAEFHLKRLQYVDNVSKSTMNKLKNVPAPSNGAKTTNNLIEYALIVALNSSPEGPKRDSGDGGDDTSAYKPLILFMWPDKLSEAEKLIHLFCFPDVTTLKAFVPLSEEIFSFYLTSACGDRKHCWCLRYSIPIAGELALRHEAICVVSKIGEPALFEQVLQAARQTRGVSNSLCVEVIKAATCLKLPRINKEVYLEAVANGGFKYTTVLKRTSESIYSTSRYGSLVRQLPMGLLVQLLASVLLERKVVLIAEKISTLSTCIRAICNLLYPFSWPHTLISALPTSLAELIDSPSPYILGVLSSTKEFLNEFHLDEVLVVSLDGGFFVRWVGDEASILPKKVQRALLLSLSEAQQDSELGRIGLTDATISESFIRMFVETCGHYRGYVDSSVDPAAFKREDFVKAVSSGSVRLFLDWFSRSSMFQIFVTERSQKNRLYDVFEERIEEYQVEMEALGSRANVMAAKDKVVKFFKSKIVKSYKKSYI